MKTIRSLILNFAVFIQVLGGATEAPANAASQVRSAETKANRHQPAGELRQHPENLRYFVDAGQPVVLMGRYHADFICRTDAHFTKDLPGYMKYLAEELNANFTQVWAIMIFSGRKEAEYGLNTGGPQYLPFLRTGPGTNYYGEPKYDLTRHDPAYFARFHDFLRATRERGIYVEITLFDICGLKQGGKWYGAFDPRWSSNPFHPDNNINDLGLPKDHALGKDRFFNLKNAKLRVIQEAFVERLLSELGGYGHIIFNICNEYDGPFDWQEHWVRRVKARCPNRLVAVNNHDSKGVPSGIEHSQVDLLNYHPGGGETAERSGASRSSRGRGRRAVAHDDVGRAILSDTDSYHPGEMGADADAEIRRFAWSCFVNGQHFADMSHAGRTDRLMHCPPLPTFRHILPFVNQVDFIHARPHPELLLESEEGECFAQPGVEYVIYLRFGGRLRLDASHSARPLNGRWYNPRTGEWGKPFEVTPAPVGTLSCLTTTIGCCT
jgi:uncharacterized protein DUF6298